MYNLPWIFSREKLFWTYVHLSYLTKYYNWSWFSWSLIDCSLQRSVRESDGVKKWPRFDIGIAFVFCTFFLVRYTRLMGAALYFLHSWVSMSQSARAASIKVALIPFAPSLDRALALSIAVLFETENLLAYQRIYTYFLLHTAALCERETNFNTNKYGKPSYWFNSWRIYLLQNVHEILFTHIECNICSLFFIYLYIWNINDFFRTINSVLSKIKTIW